MSFRVTTHWLMIAGIMILTACGISTIDTTWPLRIPTAYAASPCPAGTASMPARNTSASTAPL